MGSFMSINPEETHGKAPMFGPTNRVFPKVEKVIVEVEEEIVFEEVLPEEVPEVIEEKPKKSK